VAEGVKHSLHCFKLGKEVRFQDLMKLCDVSKDWCLQGAVAL